MPLVGLTVLLLAGAGYCYWSSRSHTPVPVSGTVTLDGKPVVGATVTFHALTNDKEGRLAIGKTDKTGTFRLKMGNEDVRPGQYKVVITKNVLADPKLKMPDFPDTPEGWNQKEYWLWRKFGDSTPPFRNDLPNRYGDLKATPLTCKVPGDTPIHFALSRK
jgi:hypothetical protein